MIKIMICAKQVSDPEAPATAYTVDTAAKKVIMQGIAPVISPFDENALEAALKLKEKYPATITVLSIGKKLSDTVFRKLLAAGADEVFLLEDEKYEDLDPYTTASILADIIKQKGGYDLILTGRQSADLSNGMVGIGISEILNMPCVTLAKKVEVDNDSVVIDRIISDGYEVIRTKTPCVATVSNEAGDLRLVGIKQIKESKQKPMTRLDSSNITISNEARSNIREIYKPKFERNCVLIESESEEELGYALADKLISDKII